MSATVTELHSNCKPSASASLADFEATLSPEKATSLRAVGRWASLLQAANAKPEEPEREKLEPVRTYLETMGFLPRDARVVSLALRSKIDIKDVVPELLEQLANGELKTSDIIDANPKTLQRRFPNLSLSQIRLLQAIIKHERKLATLDVSSLAQHFPFPITEFNYFRRFIASGCEEPRHALKHLQLAEPYFIHLRSLLEGLELRKKNMLLVSFSFGKAERHGGDKAASAGDMGQRSGAPLYSTMVEILHQSINCAHDFYGEKVSPARPRLRCINVPHLPEVTSYQFEKEEKPQLAAQLFNWLLHGDRSGALLHRQSLSPSDEKSHKLMVEQLAAGKAYLAEHQKAKPTDSSASADIRRWAGKEASIEKRLDSLEEKIADSDRRRAAAQPIIKQLESDDHVMEGVKKFRVELANALRNGMTPVFSTLAVHGKSDDSGFFATYLDAAMSANGNEQQPGCKTLQSARFILSESVSSAISRHRVVGFRSIVDRLFRDFALPVSDFSSSTQYVTARILPKSPDPKVSEFVDSIVQTGIPGVLGSGDLLHLVKAHTGRSRPRALEVLEYAFEHSATFERSKLMSLLSQLRSLGVNKIPERCVELAVSRFHFPRILFDQFKSYGERYRPQTVGALPAIFEDIASFDKYLGFRLDTHGMGREVAEVAHLLEEHGIVAIVDSTNYHPELAGTVVDQKVKEQQEATKEIWGDYVRPSERLVRSLTESIIRGKLGPSFENHSVVALKSIEKVEKVQQALIKKFYGLDLEIAPNLSQINQVLGDLTLHNDNTILVLDIETVKSLEQYREFVRMLKPYQLKIVLRCREPFPGVPQVAIRPFLDHEVSQRLAAEIHEISQKLELAKPLTPAIVEFAASQVGKLRRPADDPLNLTVAVLQGAAENARTQDGEVVEQDVTAALAPTFHLPDGDQMRLRIDALDAFAARAPLRVLGQKSSIQSVMKALKSHTLGLRNPTRPLSLLLPGPTGVGKTELLMEAALKLNLPFFMIEGAQFSESHTVFRLVGSPNGYVGDNEGILYKFLKENVSGIIFIDEIEKMHPDVYTALMNFFDKGTLTAGNGETVSRPGMIIVGACNAAADKLHHDMTRRELLDVLSAAFVDRDGKERPELVRRFEIIPMLAIEKDEFRKIIELNLNSIGDRYGFINANLRLTGVDGRAVELLYTAARDVCSYEEEARRRRGFGFGAAALKLSPGLDDLYFDMRYVATALDALSGDSLRVVAEEQFRSGGHRARGKPRLIKLVAEGDQIIAQDITLAA